MKKDVAWLRFWQVAATYGLLCLFLIIMVSFCLAGVVQGNQGLTRAQKAFVSSPNGVVTLVKGLFVPIDYLIAGLVGRTIVGLLLRFFDFMDDVIDFDDFHNIISNCLRSLIDTVTDKEIFQILVDTIDKFKDAVDDIPDSNFIGEVLSGFSNSTKKVQPLIVELQDTLRDIENGVANVSVATLQQSVEDLNSTFSQLRPKLLDVKNKTLSYVSLQDQVQETHDKLERVLIEPYSDANFDAAVTSVSDLLTASQNIPSEVDLADSLVELNDTINQAVADLDNLILTLDQTQDILDNIPSVSVVNDTLNEIVEVLQNITFDGLEDAFNGIGGLFDSLPDTTVIFATIDRIASATQYIPCVLSIGSILGRINDQVMELPASLNFSTTLDSLNSTISDTLDQVLDMKTYVRDLNETFDAGKPNTTQFAEVSDRIKASLDEAVAHIRDLQDQLVEIDLSNQNGGQFNITILILQAIEARNNIQNSDARVSAQTVQEIKDMNGTRQNLIDSTTDLNNYFLGPTFTAQWASVDADPTLDFLCVGGTTVCYDPNVTPPATATPLLASDSSCVLIGEGPGCTFAYEVIVSTMDSLVAFNTSLEALPLKSGVVTGIDSAVDKIDAVDFSNYASFDELAQLQSNLTTYLSNTDNTQGNLDEIFDLNLDDLKENFDGVDDVLESIKDNLDGYRDQITSLNDTVVSQTSIFDNVFDYEAQLYDLVNELPTTLSAINNETLTEIIKEGDGIHGALVEILEVFSGIIERFPLGNPLDSFASNLEMIRIADVAADRDGKLQEAGAINYMLSIYGAATASGALGRRLLNTFEKSASMYGSPAELDALNKVLTFVRVLQDQNGSGNSNGSGDSNGKGGLGIDLSNLITSDDIEAGDYTLPLFNGDYVDNTIVPYPGGALCLIDECLENTIDVYNTRPIPNLKSLAGFDAPVSREQAMLLPFLAPFIVILIGFLVFCLPGCGCCLSCCSICNAFFYFFIVGSLFFPMVIFTGDFCGHVESIGATNINEMEPMICNMLPASDPLVDPYNPDGYCQAGISTAFFSWDVELDAGEFFRSITEGCTGSSLANSEDGEEEEPVAALWKSLKEKVGEIVDNQLDTLVETQLTTLGVVLKQPAINVILQTSDDLVDDVSSLAENLGTALSCERISGAYLGFKDTLCCDFIGSFYWWAASFYLMAFTLLCCGCPAGALANQKLRGHKFHHVAKKTAQHTAVVAQEKYQQGKVKAQQLKERVRNGSWAPVTAVPVAVADVDYAGASGGNHVGYQPHQHQEMTSFIGKTDHPHDAKVYQE